MSVRTNEELASRLRETLNEWRARANDFVPTGDPQYDCGVENTWGAAADELDELLDDVGEVEELKFEEG